MRSEDALAAIRSGPRDWKAYNDFVEGRVDLSMNDLSHGNFKDFEFRSCDFEACEMMGASFDNAILFDCQFVETDLTHASFVGATLSSTRFVDTVLDKAVVRKSNLIDCELSLAGTKTLILEACQIQGTTIHQEDVGATLALHGVRMSGGMIRDMGGHLNIGDCVLDGVLLCQSNLESSLLQGSELRNCEVRGLRIAGCDWSTSLLDSTRVSSIDLGDVPSLVDVSFVDCRIYRCDLSRIGLEHVQLPGSALIDCSWPTQKAEVSWNGVFSSPPALMRQPVQDVLGVAPKLRREIADAQYLASLHQEATVSILRRILLRLWGASSGFGQSIVRLLAWVAVAVTILGAFHFAAANLGPLDWRPTGNLLPLGQIGSGFWNSWTQVAAAFFSFSQAPAPEVTVIYWIYWVARLLGFVALGLLIGVASTKLARLSSE